ncbi:hypothetical protein, partial [Paracoccus chinensis]|uniref:hypothetical protein n=1 Tax=Paracoccus chinensis TaxID=525640 RepID=UPI001C312B9B
PSLTALGGRVTWVKSQWKSGANPGQFQVEINTQEVALDKAARPNRPSPSPTSTTMAAAPP